MTPVGLGEGLLAASGVVFLGWLIAWLLIQPWGDKAFLAIAAVVAMVGLALILA